MIRGVAKKSIQMLNKLPAKDVVFNTLSREEIVEGKSKMDMHHRHIAFGQYVQVHTGTDNTARSCFVATIALYQKTTTKVMPS